MAGLGVGGDPAADVVDGAGVTQGKLRVVRVEPSLVVEVDADAAYEHGHWRHLTRLIRVRPDLSADEIEPWAD